MTPERPSLQDLLAAARTQAAFLPKDEAYRNFRQRSLESFSPAAARTFNTRTFILAGGAMAVIVAIVIVLSSMFRTPVQEASLAVPPNNQPAAMAVGADDSIRSMKAAVPNNPNVSVTKRVSSSETRRMPDTEQVITYEHRYPPTSFASCTPDRLDTFTPIVLTANELLKLGIYSSADGFIWEVWSPERNEGRGAKHLPGSLVQYEFGPVPALEFPLDQKGAVQEKNAVIDSVRSTIKGIPKTGTFIHPVLISNRRGYLIQSTTDVVDRHLTPPDLQLENIPERIMKQPIKLKSGEVPLQELVPIRVVVPAVPGDPPRNWDFWIYWYEPTAELLKALPERVRNTIQQDKELRRRRIEKSKYNDQLPKPLTLEACIFPNPVTQDRATVHYSLPEAGRVAMALYDITGKRLRDFALCEDRREGNWEDQVSLHGIAPGLYVLAVTTDRGEQAMQKVVVQR